MQKNYIKILKLMKSKNSPELRIILFPEAIMRSHAEDPNLKIVRSQLTQILNYIRSYPNKKYENINKLLPKRYPTTSAIAQILLYDSANYIINWVTDNSANKDTANGRFDFFDKFSGLNNLIKKVTAQDMKNKVIKKSKPSKPRPQEKNLKSPVTI